MCEQCSCPCGAPLTMEMEHDKGQCVECQKNDALKAGVQLSQASRLALVLESPYIPTLADFHFDQYRSGGF